MPFVVGGYPGPGSTGATLLGLQRAGASIAEIGLPFSDPIADGPVIAAAMHEALGRGSTPETVLDEIAAVRPSLSIGLVAMVSVSIVHRLGGPAGFASRAAAAGLDGLIIPDLPLEESGVYAEAAQHAGLTMSLLIAPTSSFQRAQDIANASSGFVYLLARAGITGERAEAPKVSPRVEKLRSVTRLPIAVGFGVSSPDHVRLVVEAADAAIVGSALVRRIADASAQGQDGPAAGAAFCEALATGLANAPPLRAAPVAS